MMRRFLKALKFFVTLGLTILFSMLLLSSLPIQAASPPQKIVIAFGGLSERSGYLFVAKDQGFFEEQGLNPQVVQVRSDPIGISALVAGDAHFYSASASGATIGAMTGGLDVVFIAGVINKLNGYFVTSAKVKTPADLKGKVLGVQSIGGGLWMYTMLALDHWGLDPERDKIQLRVIGDQAVIVQALTTGIIDGAVLGSTFGKMVERQSGRILADLAKADIPYQSTGILARRSFVDRSPDLVEKTLRAFIKTVVFIKEAENKRTVMRTLAKWLRLPRLEDAEAGYESIRTLYDRHISPTREGLRNVVRTLSKADAKFARLKADDLADDRITRRLEKEAGF